MENMTPDAIDLRKEWMAEEIKSFGVEEGTKRIETLLNDPRLRSFTNATFQLMADARREAGKYIGKSKELKGGSS